MTTREGAAVAERGATARTRRRRGSATRRRQRRFFIAPIFSRFERKRENELVVLRAGGVLVLVTNLLLAGLSCGRGADPVKESLDALVRATHERNLGAFFDRVSEDFRAADGTGRFEAYATVRGYFTAYEILNVSIRDLSIERAEHAARARFRAELSGQPRRISGLEGLLPSSISYDFDLRLVPEGGRWKISWASWQPASQGSR